jgi:DNA processing protein
VTVAYTPDQLARVGLALTAPPGDAATSSAVHAAGAPAVWAERAGRHPQIDPAAVLDDAVTQGWRLVCPTDDEWPWLLRGGGEDPPRDVPVALWASGGADLFAATAPGAVAVIGARHASDYGTQVAGALAAELAADGRTVIAAAAFGVDTAALYGAARHRTPMVAVLASTDELHHHRGVLEAVRPRGVVVTATVPGLHANRAGFQARLRLIAALASGVVLVEAPRRTPALTAMYAARRLGRVLMAVPGPITHPQSAGSHELLRTDPQVRLVTCARDIHTHLDAADPTLRCPADHTPTPR